MKLRGSVWVLGLFCGCFVLPRAAGEGGSRGCKESSWAGWDESSVASGSPLCWDYRGEAGAQLQLGSQGSSVPSWLETSTQRDDKGWERKSTSPAFHSLPASGDPSWLILVAAGTGAVARSSGRELLPPGKIPWERPRLWSQSLGLVKAQPLPSEECGIQGNTISKEMWYPRDGGTQGNTMSTGTWCPRDQGIQENTKSEGM